MDRSVVEGLSGMGKQGRNMDILMEVAHDVDVAVGVGAGDVVVDVFVIHLKVWWEM